MTETAHGYLTPETLAKYFKASVVTVQRLCTDPLCRLRIDPIAQQLALLVPAHGAYPDVRALARLSVDTVDVDGTDWFQLSVDAQGMHYEAYSVLASIVDDMRDGRSFVVAVSDALRAFRQLLDSRHGLIPERQQGLLGEMLVLRHVRDVAGPEVAVDSWLGPSAEEHDFGFDGFDAEVKTTTSETRSHVISSVTQLEASVARPLWLVSIQLTRAGTAGSGWSLAELVADLRTSLGAGNERFLDHLRLLGWRDTDHDLYLTRYKLRSAFRAYLVDGDFPAVTRARLKAVVPRPELVGDVSYRVDVSTLQAGHPPAPLGGFVQEDPGDH